jgi:S-DNA-T family DNA segregation ATPase FtsK/SpoIIIE
VGGVAGRADVERVQATVRQVHALLSEREAGFRERGIESMAEARARARRGELDPEHAADVLLVIDNWPALLRDHEELGDPLAELAAGGLQHGIHLIVTAGRWADLRQAIREAFGSRLELRLNDPMESDFGRRIAETVPPDTPGRGVTPDGLQFQIALPRMDGRDQEEELGQALAGTIDLLRTHWDGEPAPPVRVLPERVALSALPRVDQPGVAIGIEELTLAPVVLDLPGEDQHLLALGDPWSGRTSLLRTVAHALAAQAPPQARMVVVDFRRGLLDLAELPIPCTLASRPPQVEEALGQLRELTVARLRALDAAPLTGGAEGAVAPVYVLVDDYDLVGGLPLNPLAPLADLIVQGRDAGIHVVLTRATGGASRAMLDPVLSRLVESGAPAIVMSGDPHEGPLVRGLRAEPLPPGRGRLIRRRGRPVVVQLAQVDPVTPPQGPEAPVVGSRGRL